MSAAQRSRIISDEERTRRGEKTSKALSGRIYSTEHREKMRLAKLGKKKCPVTGRYI